MKFVKELFKNTLINVLWIAMFIALWPVDSGLWWRALASFGVAILLGAVQTYFKK
jgi:hypothetical protein